MKTILDGVEQVYTPAIKTKKLTGTTAGVLGVSAAIPHGLTGSKILGVEVRIEYTAGGYIAENYGNNAGFEASKQWDGTNIVIYNHATNSENIFSKPIVVLVTYEE